MLEEESRTVMEAKGKEASKNENNAASKTEECGIM